MKIHAIILATVCAVVGGTYPDTGRAGTTTLIMNQQPETWDYEIVWSVPPVTENGSSFLVYKPKVTGSGKAVMNKPTETPLMGYYWSDILSAWSLGAVQPTTVTSIQVTGTISENAGNMPDTSVEFRLRYDPPGYWTEEVCRGTSTIRVWNTQPQTQVTYTGKDDGNCNIILTLPHMADEQMINIEYADQITLKEPGDRQKITSVTANKFSNIIAKSVVNITWAADSSIASATRIVNKNGAQVRYGTPVRLTMAEGNMRDWYIEQAIDLTGQSVTGNVSVTVELL